MAWTRHLKWLFAAAIFVALGAMTSIAQAHEAHAHRAPAAVETGASATTDISATPFVVINAIQVEISYTTFHLSSDSRSPSSGCIGGCCGSMAGMACCGGAIVPGMIEAPPIELSTLFVLDPTLPMPGLPPEALPKPPKSFA
jgi:hypothetical protein